MVHKLETYFSYGKTDVFTRMYYTQPIDFGEREIVVLVHGLGISGTYMHLLASELAQNYTVYVPDLPGFGLSTKPPHVLNIQELAEALYHWSEAAGINRAYYLGNSTGCQVIVDFSIHYPNMAKAVVLQGPTIDPHMRSAGKQLLQFVANSSAEPPSQMLIMIKDYTLCGIKRVRKTFAYALDYETEKYLPNVDVPAIIVRGDMDKLISLPWAEEAARLLPQGQLSVIPGAAHTVNYANPVELAKVTYEFIEKLNVKKHESAIV